MESLKTRMVHLTWQIQCRNDAWRSLGMLDWRTHCCCFLYTSWVKWRENRPVDLPWIENTARDVKGFNVMSIHRICGCADSNFKPFLRKREGKLVYSIGLEWKPGRQAGLRVLKQKCEEHIFVKALSRFLGKTFQL